MQPAEKTAALPVVVALLVLIAGCSSPSTSPTPEPKQVTVQSTPTPAQTTGVPVQNESNRTLSVESVTYYNASPRKLRAVNETLRRFFADLPDNDTSRMEATTKVARASCGKLGRINESAFETAGDMHKYGLQFSHAAEVMQERFNSRIQPERIRTVARTSAKVGEYATIVGTYNEYVNASCAFDSTQPETVEDYYLASAALGFELLMFQYGMYYKTASKATRVASHSHSFRAIQSTFGDETLGLVMSGTHWMVRGSLQGAPDFAQRKADELNLTVSENATRGDNVTRAVEEFVGSDALPPKLDERAKNCSRKVLNGTDEEDILDAADEAGSVLGDVARNPEGAADNLTTRVEGYNASEAIEGAEGVDASNLTEEQRQKIEQCIAENGS